MTIDPRAPGEAVLAWLATRRAASGLCVQPLEWARLQEWHEEVGVLRHHTGAYFSVAALSTGADSTDVQPIILQPEVGTLGFLIGRGEGPPQMLLQAKTEPGNVGGTQIAPTVQATISNYTRAHGGSATPFLDLFHGAECGSLLADSLQSEQGTRFLGKYNRNMTVLVEHTDPADDPRYGWFDLRAVLAALRVDYAINTDARSVLVSSDWCVLADGNPFERSRGDAFGAALFDSMYAPESSCDMPYDVIEAHLDGAQRKHAQPDLSPIAIERAVDWERRADGLYDRQRSRFDVRLFDVVTTDREVSAWQQPLFAACMQHRVVLLCQFRQGVLHLLLRESREPGFREGVQIGPSAQSDLSRQDDPVLRYVGSGNGRLVAAVNQSDEGGRFHHSIARYELIVIPEHERPADLLGLSVGQIARLLQRPGAFTNEARSALSLILMWL